MRAPETGHAGSRTSHEHSRAHGIPRALGRFALPAALRAFARDIRAAAALELAIGAPVMLATAALCFDVYSYAESATDSARIAAIMADYVSRGPDTDDDKDGKLDENALQALGEFLHKHELGDGDKDKALPHLVFVISALEKPSGGAAVKLLDDWGKAPHIIKFEGKEDTVELAAEKIEALVKECSRYVSESNGSWSFTGTLPAGFTMAEDEKLVVVEVCAKLTGKDSIVAIFVDLFTMLVGEDYTDDYVKDDHKNGFFTRTLYRLHVLPARGRNLPKPTTANLERRGDGGPDTVALAFLAGAGFPMQGGRPLAAAAVPTRLGAPAASVHRPGATAALLYSAKAEA